MYSIVIAGAASFESPERTKSVLISARPTVAVIALGTVNDLGLNIGRIAHDNFLCGLIRCGDRSLRYSLNGESSR